MTDLYYANLARSILGKAEQNLTLAQDYLRHFDIEKHNNVQEIIGMVRREIDQIGRISHDLIQSKLEEGADND